MNTRNRNFGFLISTLLILFLLYNFSSLESNMRLAMIFASLTFFAISLFLPRVLGPIYNFWIKFGNLLGHIIQPFILTIMFVVIFVPIGGFLRLLKKDILDTKTDPLLMSYWTKKEKFNIINMKYQF